MSEEKNSLFYGPVLSRRFGYSLGIDLIPFKICSYDCIYCQIGKTVTKTTARKRYKEIDSGSFISGLKQNIKNASRIDFITFSGSGEPTLNSDIGTLIDMVKKTTDIPVAVLTNGSILDREEVRRDLNNADLIKISMDACNESILKKINRPYRGITFNNITEGIKSLQKTFKGRIWLEIMLLKEVNDDLGAASEFKKILIDNDILDKVESIHINTPVRPSGFKEVSAPSSNDIKSFIDVLGKKAEAINQIIGNKPLLEYTEKNGEIHERIIELAKRRPVTIREMSHSFGLNINEIIKFLRPLLKSESIKYKIYRNNRYYYC